MTRKQTLTPSKLTLLMLGVGTIALMGVPGFGHYYPPQGAVTGLVVDARGFALGGVEVALFDEHELSLVALTRTDSHGRFAFHQVPPRFDVFAQPVGDQELVGTWFLDAERAPVNHVNLVLPAGHPLTVEVKTEDGIAVSGAEVRVYDPDKGTLAVRRIATDLEGQASFVAPPRAHLAVLGPETLAPAWIFSQEIPEKGRTLAVTLQPAQPVVGRVVDDQGEPLSNVVVSGWEFDSTERWLGFALTGPDGRFLLRAGSGEAFVRAVDPLQRYLPAVEALPSGAEAEPAELVLAAGHPLEVRTRFESEGLPARIWVWSESAGAWAWGTTTSEEGHLSTVVSTLHGLVAEPLDPAYQAAESLGLTYQGPSRQLSLGRPESAPAAEAAE